VLGLLVHLLLEEFPHRRKIVSFVTDQHVVRPLFSVFHHRSDCLSSGLKYFNDLLTRGRKSLLVLGEKGVIDSGGLIFDFCLFLGLKRKFFLSELKLFLHLYVI
jgi:hypothetical protein